MELKEIEIVYSVSRAEVFASLSGAKLRPFQGLQPKHRVWSKRGCHAVHGALYHVDSLVEGKERVADVHHLIPTSSWKELQKNYQIRKMACIRHVGQAERLTNQPYLLLSKLTLAIGSDEIQYIRVS